MGDEKPATPSKGKGSTSKSGGGTAKQKNTPDKKGAAGKASKISQEDTSDDVDENSKGTAIQTPKKRAHNGDLGSDMEDETPTKMKKTEVKNEEGD